MVKIVETALIDESIEDMLAAMIAATISPVIPTGR